MLAKKVKISITCNGVQRTLIQQFVALEDISWGIFRPDERGVTLQFLFRHLMLSELRCPGGKKAKNLKSVHLVRRTHRTVLQWNKLNL